MEKCSLNMDGNSFSDLATVNKVHFTGIKGVGMAALACIGKDMGWDISGSDTAETFVTDNVLEKKGIKWSYGFDGDKLDQNMPQLLVHTSAHGGDKNPEVLRANKLGIPVISQGELLGIIANDKKYRVAVAGVGGKTTTSAMLATVIEKAGLDPSYMVGAGSVPSLEFCGVYRKGGDIFITEADEYPGNLTDKLPKFHYLSPSAVILTNLAFDHPDVYKSRDDTLRVFSDLVTKVPDEGKVIANGDCKMIRELGGETLGHFTYYGFNDSNEVQISNMQYRLGKTSFDLTHTSRTSTFAVRLAGEMNVRNATAVIVAARELGLSDYLIQKGLMAYTGVSRRLETVLKFKSTVLLDDYAHHPDEIQMTLKTIRQMYPKQKIVAVFQPHTYSRTKALFEEFSLSFRSCDIVLVADIYSSAREKEDPGVSSSILTDSINGISKNAVYIKNFGGLLEYLKNKSLTNTVFITMGAGDIFTWHGALIEQIKRSYNRWV